MCMKLKDFFLIIQEHSVYDYYKTAFAGFINLPKSFHMGWAQIKEKLFYRKISYLLASTKPMEYKLISPIIA